MQPFSFSLGTVGRIRVILISRNSHLSAPDQSESIWSISEEDHRFKIIGPLHQLHGQGKLTIHIGKCSRDQSGGVWCLFTFSFYVRFKAGNTLIKMGLLQQGAAQFWSVCGSPSSTRVSRWTFIEEVCWKIFLDQWLQLLINVLWPFPGWEDSAIYSVWLAWVYRLF